MAARERIAACGCWAANCHFALGWAHCRYGYFCPSTSGTISTYRFSSSGVLV